MQDELDFSDSDLEFSTEQLGSSSATEYPTFENPIWELPEGWDPYAVDAWSNLPPPTIIPQEPPWVVEYSFPWVCG